jgi:GrpB-like predicted nucleotidyltransferase (UPF0157 family)
MPSIRNLAVGLPVKDGHVLAQLCRDRTKGQDFYRAIGGGIDLGETAEVALRREFGEELGWDLGEVRLLDVVENVFTFDGRPGHEIVHVFAVTADDVTAADVGRDLTILDLGTPARWVPLADLRPDMPPLYPEGAQTLARRLGRPRIAIVPADPGWPAEFRRLAADLRGALGDLALRIDHIGSTSVPGLAAKDVIDVQITVADLDDDAVTTALATLGAQVRTDLRDHVPPGQEHLDDAHWRKRYAVPPPHWRRTHLHVREDGRANQRYALLFRDHLRDTPGSAAAYEQIKRALAAQHADDVDAYYAVKDPACDLIADAAERWAAQTGWTPPPSDA